jgi:hypothetical protein
MSTRHTPLRNDQAIAGVRTKASAGLIHPLLPTSRWLGAAGKKTVINQWGYFPLTFAETDRKRPFWPMGLMFQPPIAQGAEA